MIWEIGIILMTLWLVGFAITFNVAMFFDFIASGPSALSLLFVVLLVIVS